MEQMEFEEVDYWDELVEIMGLGRRPCYLHLLYLLGSPGSHVPFLWSEEASVAPEAVRSLPPQSREPQRTPVRGFDDEFYAPHSRHTTVDAEEIRACKELTVLAESDEAGVFIAMAEEGRKIFVFGHPEYDRLTLEKEYMRDKNKGLDIQMPKNYFPGADSNNRPILMWRAPANTLYTNWINYYVYQNTPYEWDDEE